MDSTIIGAIITFILCMSQVIVFVCIVSKSPIKLKQKDTLQRIRKKKKNYSILVFVLAVISIVSIGYGLGNQIAILSYIGLLLMIFIVIGISTICIRIEEKEKLLQGNNSFNVAMQKVKDMTLKDSITIVDKNLRKAIILDDIKEIKNMHILFKTGEKCEKGLYGEDLIRAITKPYQDKIIKANIKALSLTELEDDKFKLGVETQSGNSFSTIIEKVDLPKWIK